MALELTPDWAELHEMKAQVSNPIARMGVVPVGLVLSNHMLPGSIRVRLVFTNVFCSMDVYLYIPIYLCK